MGSEKKIIINERRKSFLFSAVNTVTESSQSLDKKKKKTRQNKKLWCAVIKNSLQMREIREHTIIQIERESFPVSCSNQQQAAFFFFSFKTLLLFVIPFARVIRQMFFKTNKKFKTIFFLYQINRYLYREASSCLLFHYYSFFFSSYPAYLFFNEKKNT